jgi:hypothetical protein
VGARIANGVDSRFISAMLLPLDGVALVGEKAMGDANRCGTWTGNVLHSWHSMRIDFVAAT